MSEQRFDAQTTFELLVKLAAAGQALEAAHGVLRLAHGGSGEATATVRILYESCLALIHETWTAFLAFRASPDPDVRAFVEEALAAMHTPARETVPPSDPDTPGEERS